MASGTGGYGLTASGNHPKSNDEYVESRFGNRSQEDNQPIEPNQAKPWMKYVVVAGGVLIHLSLGTLYTFGNLSPYITSYLRMKNISDVDYGISTWIYACGPLAQGIAIFGGGLLERKIGPRLCVLLGSWVMAIGVALTYFTIDHSFELTLLTYGVMFGIGLGIAYAIPMAVAMRWLPKRKGLVNGFVIAGFGCGAFIFTYVQTGYINPNNLKPDSEDNQYFSQAEVLDRVPSVFLILGGTYAVMQLLGSLVMVNPPGYKKANISKAAEKKPLLHDDANDQEEEYARPPQKEIEPDTTGLMLTPLQMLKHKSFYLIWATFLVNGTGVLFITTLYKAYGQTFIQDDIFLAIVGAFASIGNGIGRITWGFLGDKFSFKVSMLCVCASFTVLMLTLQLTQQVGRVMFFIWVFFLFFSFGGNFSLFPTATARAYGQEYYPLNYGFVFSSQALSMPLGAILTSQLKEVLGWDGMFFLCSGLSAMGGILTSFFNVKRIDGRDI